MKKKINNVVRRLALSDEQMYNITIVLYILLFMVLTAIFILDYKVRKDIAKLEERFERIEATYRNPDKSVKQEIWEYIYSLPLPEEDEQVLEEQNSKVYSKQEVTLEEANEEIADAVLVTFKATGYCPCKKCCGKTDGITASGKKATVWHTIAASKEYPLGTKVFIPELEDMPNEGWFVVEDRGGAIVDNRIDIYFSTHSEAEDFGVASFEGYVYYPEEN